MTKHHPQHVTLPYFTLPYLTLPYLTSHHITLHYIRWDPRRPKDLWCRAKRCGRDLCGSPAADLFGCLAHFSKHASTGRVDCRQTARQIPSDTMGKTRADDLSPGNGTDSVCTVQDWKLRGVYMTLYRCQQNYITLHYITLHYTTLHYITLHYIILHPYIAL